MSLFSAVGNYVKKSYEKAKSNPFEALLYMTGVNALAEAILDIQEVPPDRGATLNFPSSDRYIPVIYGTQKVGGSYAYVGTSGAEREYLHIALVVSEGEITSFQSIYVDDVSYNNAKYSGLIAIDTNMVGTPSQSAQGTLVSAFAEWTSAHQLKGVAYLYLRFRWNRDVFRGLPKIVSLVNGIKLYDPRDLSTSFSRNPALALYDYLTNNIYGKGLSSTDLDIDSFKSAADYCDELVTRDGDGGTQGTHKRYEIDVKLDTKRKIMDNVKTLLKPMRGMLPFVNGKYKLVLDKDETSVFEFNEDNIIGGWQIVGTDKRNKFNRVNVTFSNKNKDYQNDIAAVSSATFLAEDSGVRLEANINMPAITDYYRAVDHASYILKKSRQGITVTFVATIAAIVVESGDVVDVNHPTPGWTPKQFRVIDLNLLANGNVQVTLLEHESIVYNRESISLEVTPPNTYLPDPYIVTAPVMNPLESGTIHLVKKGSIVYSQIYVSWSYPNDIFINRYHVEFKKSSDSVWLPGGVAEGSQTLSLYIINVDDGVDYDIRVRSENSLGALSTWDTTTNYTVVGKEEPPNVPTGVTLTSIEGALKIQWTNPSDLDIKSVEIFADTTSPTLIDMIDVDASGSPGEIQTYTIPLTPGSTRFVKIRLLDLSRRASAMVATTPASATAGAYKYLTGETVDSLKPAVAGADVNSPSISLRVNKTGLTAVNVGEAFIHGFDSSGAPADIDGYINFNGNKLTVPRSESGSWTIATEAVGAGYIIFDTTKSGKFTVASTSVSLAFAKKVNGSWSYDNNTGNWIAFTPSSTDTIIGTLVTDSADSIKTGEVWANGISPDVVADGGATVSRVFVQTNPPSALVATDEDVWIDSDDNNKLYVRESGTWVSRRDPTADWNNVDLIPEAELFSVDDSSRLGYNPGFANWSAGKPQNWNATGTNHFEENTIRQMGSSSVKFVTDGTTDETLTFINSSLFTSQNAQLSAGTFFIVSFSYYLTEITGAGRPGVSMILYTSGVAKYYDIEIGNTTLDVWHQQYFIARANVGTIIQGIEMEVAGASNFMPNGRANCTVYFDKCGFNIIDGDSLAYDDGTRLHDLKPAEVNSDVTGNHVFDSTSSNLVVDGDMERTDTAWWANAGVTKVADPAFGTYCLDVANPGNYATNKQPDGTLLFFPVEVGDKIHIKAWVKNVGTGAAAIGLNLANATKGYIGLQQLGWASGTSWELVEGSFTIAIGSTVRYVNAVCLNVGGGASARFDQVEMIKAPRTIGKGATGIVTANLYIESGLDHLVTCADNIRNDKINGQYIHNPVTNNGRFTVPNGVSKVRLTARIGFTANAAGYRKVAIRKNNSETYSGSTLSITAPADGDLSIINLTTPVLEVVPGDFFTVVVKHGAGVTLYVQGAADGSQSWIHMEVVE